MPHAKTIAIIGAGPVGLAAGAHALERGLKPIILEAGPEIGHAVRQWGHVRMFSSWQHNTTGQPSGFSTAPAGINPSPRAIRQGESSSSATWSRWPRVRRWPSISAQAAA
jgi:glycine/D-amino acid oxidase-like deaminating enzyme